MDEGTVLQDYSAYMNTVRLYIVIFKNQTVLLFLYLPMYILYIEHAGLGFPLFSHSIKYFFFKDNT